MGKVLRENIKLIVSIIAVLIVLGGIAAGGGALRNQVGVNRREISNVEKDNKADHIRIEDKIDKIKEKIGDIDRRTAVTAQQTKDILNIVDK